MTTGSPRRLTALIALAAFALLLAGCHRHGWRRHTYTPAPGIVHHSPAPYRHTTVVLPPARGHVAAKPSGPHHPSIAIRPPAGPGKGKPSPGPGPGKPGGGGSAGKPDGGHSGKAPRPDLGHKPAPAPGPGKPGGGGSGGNTVRPQKENRQKMASGTSGTGTLPSRAAQAKPSAKSPPEGRPARSRNQEAKGR